MVQRSLNTGKYVILDELLIHLANWELGIVKEINEKNLNCWLSNFSYNVTGKDMIKEMNKTYQKN